MKKYPHGLTLIAVCAAIEDYQRHEDSVPEEGILAAFNTLLGHSDIAEAFRALEAQRDALAAENDLARKAVQVFCDVVGSHTDALCEDAGEEGARAVLTAMDATGNMPATDAYLNSVRAEGVEIAAKEVDGWVGADLLAFEIRRKAAQLRAGKDGE